MFALYLRRAVRGALSARSFAALWPATFFVFLLVANLTESALVHCTSLPRYPRQHSDDVRSPVDSLTRAEVHAT